MLHTTWDLTSPSRDGTHALPTWKAWSLNHRTTREIPSVNFLTVINKNNSFPCIFWRTVPLIKILNTCVLSGETISVWEHKSLWPERDACPTTRGWFCPQSTRLSKGKTAFLCHLRQRWLSFSLYLSGSRSNFVGVCEVSIPGLLRPVSRWASFRLVWILPLFFFFSCLQKISSFLSSPRWGCGEMNWGVLAPLPALRWPSTQVSFPFPLDSSPHD